MFSDKILQAIKEHAEREYPKESCGFVTEYGYHPQINIASDPYNTFEIDNSVYIELEGTLLAIVHSHPDGNYFPSLADMRAQVATNVPWGIAHVTQSPEKVAIARDPFWWGGSTPIPALEGRPFQHGVTDCYSLVRDYFKLKRNIALDEFPRSWEWWDLGDDLYSDNFKSQGFIEIVSSDVQEGDCFLAAIRSPVINHAGVYVGNGLILHQLGTRGGFSLAHTSGTSPLYRWQKLISKWVRYVGR